MLALLVHVLRAAGVAARARVHDTATARPALLLLDAPSLVAQPDDPDCLQQLAHEAAAWLDAEVGAARRTHAVIGLDTAALLPLHEAPPGGAPAGHCAMEARTQWRRHAFELDPAVAEGRLACPPRLASLVLDCIAAPSSVARTTLTARVEAQLAKAPPLAALSAAERTVCVELAVAQAAVDSPEWYTRRVVLAGDGGRVPLTAARQGGGERGFHGFPEPPTALGKLLRYVSAVGAVHVYVERHPTLTLRADTNFDVEPTVIVASARPDALAQLLVYAYHRERLRTAPDAAATGLAALPPCPPDVWLRLPVRGVPPALCGPGAYGPRGCYLSLSDVYAALERHGVDVPTLAVLALVAGANDRLAATLWAERAHLRVVPDTAGHLSAYTWLSLEAAADAYRRAHYAALGQPVSPHVMQGGTSPLAPLERAMEACHHLRRPPDDAWAAHLQRALHAALCGGAALSEAVPPHWLVHDVYGEAPTGYRLVKGAPVASAPCWVLQRPHPAVPDAAPGDCVHLEPAPRPWW